jgi:beta-N-acetylhexosaminidase
MVRAFVCGCLGPSLSAAERAFLKESAPLGVILFKRNIETPDQVAALTAEIRSALGRDDAFVLVDQEGGRVQRLGSPHWRRYPPAARFTSAFPDLDARLAAIKLAARLMAEDLRQVGIDVDCLPVLDVPVEGSHDIIGDRAYARDPKTVARLGRAAADGLLAGGVLPVMKHVPGHGRAAADSHLALPIVEASLEALAASDFLPFQRNADLPAAMTAHVVYTAIDPDNPATISPRVIREIVRGAIGFDGLLFSDDLSMQALPGTFREKTERLFAAGVDIALHCNGEPDEAAAVAGASPILEGLARARVDRALASLHQGQVAFDPVDAVARLERVLATPA